MPEVRRLVDWRAGYNSVSIISVLPLISLLPFGAAVLYARKRRFSRAFAVCAWLWFGGFAFSFAVGVANDDLLGATYTFAEFIVPMLFGLWLGSIDVPTTLLFEKISGFLLLLATPIALYGVLQYVALPAWDAAWMRHANITSIGLPLPFLLRPFSTLNAPGPFADFLAAVLLLNLPRVGRFKPIQIGALTLIIGALALTAVRSSWLALVLGLIAYIMMSPRRGRNIMVFAGVGILGAILVLNASELLGSAQAGNNLSQRFGTLTNLSHDQSYVDRQQYVGFTLISALEQPIGLGLGDVGTATKLTTGGTTDFDNGYVARLVEMGYFGMLCYLGTLAAGLFLTFRYWRSATRMKLQHEAAIGASVFAVQLALVGLDVSSDHHANFSGLFFWMTLALACRPHEAPEPLSNHAKPRRGVR